MNTQNAMNGSCPNCGNEESFILVKGMEDFNIRGEIIPVEVEFYRCEKCNEEFEKPSPDYDPVAVAYSEYRRRKGMVQPEEIRSFRKKYGFTQKELSELFGIGIATLNRYENGALQDEAHDRVLKMGMDPHNLLQLLRENSIDISEKTRNEIIQRVEQEQKQSEDWVNTTIDFLGNYQPDLLSGYHRFSIEKFTHVIKFFCHQAGTYKTKLMKELFFSDFKHFKDYSVSITGTRYAHLPYGPVPDQFETWFSVVMALDPTITKEEVWFNPDAPAERYKSQTQPDFSLFSSAEIKTLAAVREKFENLNAKQISDFSHNEKGYQSTKDGELISYQFAVDLQI